MFLLFTEREGEGGQRKDIPIIGVKFSVKDRSASKKLYTFLFNLTNQFQFSVVRSLTDESEIVLLGNCFFHIALISMTE